MKKSYGALLAVVLWASAAAAQAPDPAQLSTQRVVFHTLAGDLVFALYPNAAPKTVEQFLKLVGAGVYDTTAFTRVKPGFIVQLGSASQRRQPLTGAQAAMIHRLPMEPSALKHVQGILSMARKEQDPESAETSFCILLGAAPQLDGKYTAFGRLESGADVLAQMVAVPRDERSRPLVRLEVTRAEVVPSTQALASMKLQPARPIAGAPAPTKASAALRAAATPHAVNDPAQQRRLYFLAIGLALMALLGAVKVLVSKKLSPRHLTSLDLVNVLISAFLLLVLLVPEGHRMPWLAGVLFIGVIGVLKLLGRFEAPAG